MPRVECCVERVRTRLDHGFSDEAATRKMHDEFANASIEARHVIEDPPDDIDAVAHLILDLRSRASLTIITSPAAHSVE